MAGPLRVDHAVTNGVFNLDGETHQVDNNVWVVGDDDECVVIDAPHDVDAILELVGVRRVRAILLTHAHDDHCRMAPGLAARTGAPIHLHPDEAPLWELTHPARPWDRNLAHGTEIPLGSTTIRTLHTPGHAPGACCFHVPALGCVFTGDTLFRGGPGATGRSFSDAATLEDSIRAHLFSLAGWTVVHTGHGADTSIGRERAYLNKRTSDVRRPRLVGEESSP
jgi:glyoxylase-like metal-dependent hydrolase (beta-lactamase superfamily II)